MTVNARLDLAGVLCSSGPSLTPLAERRAGDADVGSFSAEPAESCFREEEEDVINEALQKSNLQLDF